MQKSLNVRRVTGLLAAAVFVGTLSGAGHADPISGDLYYTLFSGTERVKKVEFSYDGVSSFALGAKTVLATGIGADGIAGNPNDPNSLFIGGQGGVVYRVSRDGPSTNGAAANGVISATGVPNAAFHLEVPNSSTLYSSGIPGGAFNSTVINPDGTLGATTSVGVTGDDTVLTQIITTPYGSYYTTASPSGPGNVGALSISGATSTTTRLHTGVASAHGGTYDSFTDTFMTFGDNFISQFDAATGALVGTLDLSTLGIFVNLDQGTVDGAGHILAASNDGELFFMDYAATGLILSSTFATEVFLDNFLDDVAPLSGAGSTQVPEPAGLAAIALGLGAIGYARRRRTS